MVGGKMNFCALQSNSLFEDREIVESGSLGFYFFSGSCPDDFIKKLFCQILQRGAVHHSSTVEINPVGFPIVQCGVGGNLHCGYRAGKRCAPAGGKKYDMRAGGSQCC